MSMTLMILYFIYPIVGICTLQILSKYKMRKAYTLYTVIFLLLFFFLPVYAGNELLEATATYGISQRLLVFLRNNLYSPFAAVDPYMVFTFTVMIILSIFIILSVLCIVLMATVEIVRKLRSDDGEDIPETSTYKYRRISDLRVIPEVNYCHTLCRYNC